MIHRREIVSFSMLTFALCGSALPAPAWAQGQPGRTQLEPQSQAPPQTQRQPRPQVQEQPVAENIEVSAAVQQLLDLWEERSSQINQLYCVFDLYSYDGSFFVEQRNRGRLWFAAPDKGRIDFGPPESLEQSEKLDPNGAPYRVEAGSDRRWICSGARVFAIDDSSHVYSEVTIPPQFQGENIIDSPLPFLFGMQAEKAKQRYQISIGSMHNPDGRIEGAPLNVHVVVVPRWEQDAREWSSAEILLNPETFLPNAVRIITGPANEEVYVFVEAEPALRNVNLFNLDAFNDRPPGNYTCIDSQTAAAPQPLERSASLPPRQGIIPQ
jgi:TIGR03009 family protein